MMDDFAEGTDFCGICDARDFLDDGKCTACRHTIRMLTGDTESIAERLLKLEHQHRELVRAVNQKAR